MSIFHRNPNQPKPTIRVGDRYDAEPVELQWPFLNHTLIAGVTGSGKSSWTASIVGEVAGHNNTAIIGVDLKRVELGLSKPRFTTLATEPDQVTALFSKTQQLVNHRADVLELFGLRTWDFDLGPAVLLIVEELAEVAALDSKVIAEALDDPANAKRILAAAASTTGLRIQMLASICRLARFVAVTVVCATQYPLASIVPPELRSNLTGRIGGRVSGREQIDVALGAGMSEHIFADDIAFDEPGVAYVFGFDGYPKPIRCRADYPTDDQIKQRAADTAHLRFDATELFDFTTKERPY